MFAWLRSRRLAKRLVRLRRRHLQLLEQARDLQRRGDIRAFADMTAAATVAEQELEAAEQQAAAGSGSR